MLTNTIQPTNYPIRLRQLHDVPEQLHIASHYWEELAKMPMLAVVGARKPSSYGAAICAELVRHVASRGVCIVSGLALGIDGIAHRAALEVGGATIAVLPSGVASIYPASHKQLAESIIEKGGALISEYPDHQKIAHKSYFIARNRIIAGLSQAVLIPEAALKSGSLHTAKFALDAGAEVLAVPGQLTNPTAAGCNMLIKNGATLITSADDVLAALGIASSPHSDKQLTANTPEEYVLLSLIQKGVHDADDLLLQSKLKASIFNQTLTMLEITGRIAPRGGNTWYLTNS